MIQSDLYVQQGDVFCYVNDAAGTIELRTAAALTSGFGARAGESRAPMSSAGRTRYAIGNRDAVATQ